MLGAPHLAVASVVMFAGSTVLSTVGFGIGMTTTPVLLLMLEPQTVVVLVNTVSLVLFVLIIFQTRSHLPTREMAPVSAAGLLGVPVGVFILSEASPTMLRVAISAIIIALAASAALNVRGPVPKPGIVGPAVGLVVGVLLTSTGIGGPLMALFLLAGNRSRQALRGALSLYFLFIEATGVVGYAIAGLYTLERVVLILVVTAPVLLGFGLATLLVGRMNEQMFRRSALAVIIATSLMVLGREALEL